MKEQEATYKANMGAKDGEIKHLQVVKGTVIRDEGTGGGLQGQHGAKDGEIKHLQVVKGTVIRDEGAGGSLQGQHGGQGRRDQTSSGS
jgi:hypothetical protein